MILEVETKRGCRARVRNRDICHREIFLVDVKVVAELCFGGGSLAVFRTSCPAFQKLHGKPLQRPYSMSVTRTTELWGILIMQINNQRPSLIPSYLSPGKALLSQVFPLN